jgi:hypothetical protein
VLILCVAVTTSFLSSPLFRVHEKLVQHTARENIIHLLTLSSPSPLVTAAVLLDVVARSTELSPERVVILLGFSAFHAFIHSTTAVADPVQHLTRP